MTDYALHKVTGAKSLKKRWLSSLAACLNPT